MVARGSEDLSIHWAIIFPETKTHFFASRLMSFPPPRHLDSGTEGVIEPGARRLPVSTPLLPTLNGGLG